jgi:hypothetical protein
MPVAGRCSRVRSFFEYHTADCRNGKKTAMKKTFDINHDAPGGFEEH